MGTKLEIWRQGQFYPEMGKKIVELPYLVNSGPSDHQIIIEGFNVQPDNKGNFLNISYSEDELDAIHTYGVIRMVIDLYENLLGKPLKWIWQQNGSNQPLKVRIRNNDINARYLKDQKCIELDYYGPYNNWTYNCRTVDLIAHETGHAILDSILPFLNNGNAEARGIGETFCDLTAMFMVLSQYDLCEYVIDKTKGDLMQNSILTLFGVGHGYKENQFKEIRNAVNNIKYKINAWSPYDYSQVFIGILYEILVEIFKENKKSINNDSENLYKSGRNWMNTIMKIFQKFHADNSNISNLKHYLIHYFGTGNNKLIKHLKRRDIP